MNNYTYLCMALALGFFGLGTAACSVSENADKNSDDAWGLKEPKIIRFDEANLNSTPMTFRKAHQEWDHYNWSDTLIFSKQDKKSGNIRLHTRAECSAGNVSLAPYSTQRELNQDLPLYKMLSLEMIQLLDQTTETVSCRFAFRAENMDGATHTFELERRNFLASQHTNATHIRRIRNLSESVNTSPNTINFETLHLAQIIYEQTTTTTVQMLCGSYLRTVLHRMNSENLAQLYKEEVFASHSLHDEKCRILGYDKNNLLNEMSDAFYVRNPFPFPKIISPAKVKNTVIAPPVIQVGVGPFTIENISDENFWIEIPEENNMNLTAELILYNLNNRHSYAHIVPIQLQTTHNTSRGKVVVKRKIGSDSAHLIPVPARTKTTFQITARIRNPNCSGPYKLEGARIHGSNIEKSLPYKMYRDGSGFESSLVASGYLAERIDIWAGIKNPHAKIKVNKPLGPKKIRSYTEKKCR